MNSMKHVPPLAAMALVLGALPAGAAGEGCNPDLSSSRECWHSCETEDEITICEIIVCPEGINCSGVDSDPETGLLSLSIPAAEPVPPLGEEMVRYVGGREVRGSVTTRLMQAVSATTRGQTELVIVVTPVVVSPAEQ